MSVFFVDNWNILQPFGIHILLPFGIFYILPFGIFCGLLLIFPRFGMLYQEKSGNPD
jgi:hypothetical protein